MNWREPIETEFALLFIGGEECDIVWVMENDRCFTRFEGEWIPFVGVSQLMWGGGDDKEKIEEDFDIYAGWSGEGY